uniref:Uncharacterized protein n=1 Tax=Romanomermis culicivorax TaxID=13658 RepID=A0A915HGW9_ROMCU
MEVTQQVSGVSVMQIPPSVGNPDYISPLKRDLPIGQPVRDHSGQRNKCQEFEIFLHMVDFSKCASTRRKMFTLILNNGHVFSRIGDR